MKHTLHLFDFFIALPDNLVHRLYLPLECGVKIILHTIITAFLETLTLQLQSQLAPLVRQLSKEFKKSAMLLIRPRKMVPQFRVQMVLIPTSIHVLPFSTLLVGALNSQSFVERLNSKIEFGCNLGPLVTGHLGHDFQKQLIFLHRDDNTSELHSLLLLLFYSS